MRINFTLFLLLVLISPANLVAQIPEKISFQAVVRNAEEDPVREQTVSIRISILQGSADGDIVWSETLSVATDAHGVVAFEFGNEQIGDIDWENGPWFIRTETDPAGNTNYTVSATSQLLSVPYALYAGSSRITVSETDPVFSAAFDLAGAKAGDLFQFDGEKWNILRMVPAEKDHVHLAATEDVAGFLSSGDKARLNELYDLLASATSITAGRDIVITGDGTPDEPYAINTTNGTQPGEMRYWNGSNWTGIPIDGTFQIPPGLTFCDDRPVWGTCPGVAVVNIVRMSEIGGSSATVFVWVVSDGEVAITERGVCFSTEPDPTTDDNLVPVSGGLGSFHAKMEGLESGTTYWVRAYAVNNSGTFYSSQIGFSMR